MSTAVRPSVTNGLGIVANIVNTPFHEPLNPLEKSGGFLFSSLKRGKIPTNKQPRATANSRGLSHKGVFVTTPNDTPSSKICTKCGTEYPNTPEYFHSKKRRNGTRYLIPECKPCVIARSRTWYENNRERALVSRTEYTKSHLEQAKAAKRRHYEKNKAVIMAKAKVYLKEHRELRNQYARAHNARRRAWKRNSPGKSYTRKDIELQFKSQKGKCWHCGKSIADYYEVDHLTPLSRGGSNAANNIVLACKSCNRDKSDLHPYEWNGRLF